MQTEIIIKYKSLSLFKLLSVEHKMFSKEALPITEITPVLWKKISGNEQCHISYSF